MKKVTTQQQQKPQTKKVVKKAKPKAKKISKEPIRVKKKPIKVKETAPKKASTSTPIISKFNVITINDGNTTKVEIQFGGYITDLIEGIVETANAQPKIEYFLQRLCEDWMVNRVESFLKDPLKKAKKGNKS